MKKKYTTPLRVFYCQHCGRYYLGLCKHFGLNIHCYNCKKLFAASNFKDMPLPPLYPPLLEDDPELIKEREQLAQERKKLRALEEKRKAEPGYKEKKKSPWDGAFWEVTGEILFGVMVLVLIVPIAIVYVGCLAFGGRR